MAEVRGSPAAVEAEQWAPQAHAHALELEERAERALNDGDDAGAALLAEQAIAARLGIRSIPTLIAYRNGKEIARQSGAIGLPQLMQWIGTHAGAF